MLLYCKAEVEKTFSLWETGFRVKFQKKNLEEMSYLLTYI